MPSVEEKTIFRQVNKIKNKFKGVREETENVITLLHECLVAFDHRIKELDGCEVGHFASLYRKLNHDIEEFQDKVIYIQASVEPPSYCEDASTKPFSECENELHNQQETDLPSCHVSESTSSLQSPSQSSNSSHIFPSECVSTSAKLDSSAKISSTLVAASNKNLESSEASFSPTACDTIDTINLPKNVTPEVISTNNANDTFAALTPKPNNSHVSNVSSCSSNSFASVNEIEKSEVDLPAAITEIDKNQRPTNSASERSVNQNDNCNFQQSSSCIISDESLSQVSYHNSLSSNLSDYKSVSSEQDTAINDYQDTSILCASKYGGSQTVLKKRVISPIQIDCPMTTMATITHIENPGNFWMRLDNFEASKLTFPKKLFSKSNIPSAIEVNDFFLAPSKSVPIYLRVKVVKVNANDDTVKVFRIDYGSTQNVPKSELRILPSEAYNIPMQAINCCLADISARNGIWCFAAICKLKECTGSNSIETHIKYQINKKYAVQLTATLSEFDIFLDVGQSLCIDGYAIEDEKPLQITERNSAPDLCDNNLSSSGQTSIQLQTSNQLSNDSGVSVTSNLPSTSFVHAESSGSLNSSQFQNALQELCSERLVFQETTDNKVTDLISFESTEKMQNDSSTTSELKAEAIFPEHNKCLKIGTCKCPLHLLIPFPSIKFVSENKVLVMLSHVAHPNDFYVNMVMESSITLDELHEEMFNTYNSISDPDTYFILMDDLREGMFCAAYYDDGNWYRAKVLDINRSFAQSRNVLVQYVDYGNKSWVQNTDLRTLTPEFAKHPVLSLKCSLAGIVPADPVSCYSVDTGLWDEKAVNVFKSLVGFEKCLTAEIRDRTVVISEDPLQVFLWDTQGENDFLVNDAFAATELAKYDLAALEKLLDHQNRKQSDVKRLNAWDPMTAEYNDMMNSYGVNVDDIQVATGGYKPRDEEYICKYYSLRGYCPRKSCPYEHTLLAEGGVTRDKDELYSFNCPPPLPKDGSYVLVQVSAVISPSFFYVQLPFGNLSVDELDSLINQGVSRESLQSQEIKELYGALNDRYTNKPFDETTTVALSYGTIVVAKRQYDQTWHRARIIDVQDIAGPAKVFYVDFGNEEWVERRNIRQISPEFLHAPFQAVECCLYDVEPLGFERGKKWSSYAVGCFKDLVSETVMLAHIACKFNDTLQVSLRRATEIDHLTMRDHLIREGFGQEKLLIKTKKPVTNYVPG